MKNPFDKEDQTLLVTTVVIGAVTVGALSWLWFTKSGNAFLKSKVVDLAAIIVCRQTGLSHKFVRPVMHVIVN
ncbi:hypothetical protein AAFN85_16980 [Mucilaginibacter sp. CAU 1740]|uniref:hypothetical protein n=1 Tax=Mucilaginibacter sp. CAU 1740 TaxID=3140365 RepID=UPI00325BF579